MEPRTETREALTSHTIRLVDVSREKERLIGPNHITFLVLPKHWTLEEYRSFKDKLRVDHDKVDHEYPDSNVERGLPFVPGIAPGGAPVDIYDPKTNSLDREVLGLLNNGTSIPQYEWLFSPKLKEPRFPRFPSLPFKKEVPSFPEVPLTDIVSLPLPGDYYDKLKAKPGVVKTLFSYLRNPTPRNIDLARKLLAELPATSRGLKIDIVTKTQRNGKDLLLTLV